jgi:hypothetical protein
MGTFARIASIAVVIASTVTVLASLPDAASAGVPAIVPVVPGRILETRQGPNDATVDGLFQGGGVVAGGAEVALQVEGRHGVTGAVAAMLNVTAVGPEGPGHLTVYPCGSPRPLSSSVNYTAGQVVPNAVLAKLGDGGKVCIWTKATTHILVDVTAFVPGDPGGGGVTTTTSPTTGPTTTPTTTTPATAPGGIGTFLPHVGLDDQRLAVGPDGAFHVMWVEDYGGTTVVYGRCTANCEIESSWQLREIFDHAELDNLWLSPGGLGVDGDGRVHALLGGFCAGGSTCPGGDGQFYVTCASSCNGAGTWSVVDLRPALGAAYADGDSNLLMLGTDDSVSFFTTGGDYAECASACNVAGNWSNNWVIHDLDGVPGDDPIAHAERGPDGTTHVIFDDGTVNGDTVFAYARCAVDCLQNASWQSSHVYDGGGNDLGQGGQLSRTTAYQSSIAVDATGRLYFAGNQGTLGSFPTEPFNNLLVMYSCAADQCLDAGAWDLFAFENPGEDTDGEYAALAAHGTAVYLTSVASMDVYLRACASGCADPAGWTSIAEIDESQAINAAVPASVTCQPSWYWPKYPEIAVGPLGVVEIHRAQPLCGTPPTATYGPYVGRVFADF